MKYLTKNPKDYPIILRKSKNFAKFVRIFGKFLFF
jgi:hypothetical protein